MAGDLTNLDNSTTTQSKDIYLSRANNAATLLTIAQNLLRIGVCRDKDVPEEEISSMIPLAHIDTTENLLKYYGDSINPVLDFFDDKFNQELLVLLAKGNECNYDFDLRNDWLNQLRQKFNQRGIDFIFAKNGFTPDNNSYLRSPQEISEMSQSFLNSDRETVKAAGIEYHAISEQLKAKPNIKWVLLLSEDFLEDNKPHDLIEDFIHEYDMLWFTTRNTNVKRRDQMNQYTSVIKFGDQSEGKYQNHLLDALTSHAIQELSSI
jgi:hypothetical protein